MSYCKKAQRNAHRGFWPLLGSQLSQVCYLDLWNQYIWMGKGNRPSVFSANTPKEIHTKHRSGITKEMWGLHRGIATVVDQSKYDIYYTLCLFHSSNSSHCMIITVKNKLQVKDDDALQLVFVILCCCWGCFIQRQNSSFHKIPS